MPICAAAGFVCMLGHHLSPLAHVATKLATSNHHPRGAEAGGVAGPPTVPLAVPPPVLPTAGNGQPRGAEAGGVAGPPPVPPATVACCNLLWMRARYFCVMGSGLLPRRRTRSATPSCHSASRHSCSGGGGGRRQESLPGVKWRGPIGVCLYTPHFPTPCVHTCCRG